MTDPGGTNSDDLSTTSTANPMTTTSEETHSDLDGSPELLGTRRAARRRSIVPAWATSIKFRLAMTYAITVYALAVLIIGGIYASQVRQLDDPLFLERQVAIVDVESGRTFPAGTFADDARIQSLLVSVERNSYSRTLDNLKNASLAGLALMVVVAFGVGWLLASVTLRPINAMVAVARDITGTDLSRRIDLKGHDDELKRLADTFDSMLDRLQTAFENQRRFVQDASHELRNPLATARASLELALTDPEADTHSLRDAAEIAHRSTERMAGLVDDLLMQARTGVPEISLGEVSVTELVGDVVEQFRAAAGQRSVRLVFEHGAPGADDSRPGRLNPANPIVTGDESGLYRAVSNLVSNAIRHAPAGTVVDIAVGQLGPSTEIAVTDHGRGLTDHEKSMVFQRFWTGEGSTEGTGLGLNIVQQIAHRHGGSVRVHSVVGQGATFVLQLPTKHLEGGDLDTDERRYGEQQRRVAETVGLSVGSEADGLGSASEEFDTVVTGME